MNSEDLSSFEEKLTMRGLSADRLRTIYYVAQTQSATKAAEKLFVCQSAVTKQIQQIEDELGILIFNRRDRRFILTELGHQLFHLAQRTLHDIDGTIKSIKEEYVGMGGRLKIITYPSFVSVMMPRYLKGFDRIYPELKLDILSPNSNLIPLEEDVSIRQLIPDNNDLQHLKLYDQVIGLYASKDYIEQYGAPETMEDLESFNLLALDPSLEVIFKQVNWILNVGIEDSKKRRKAYMHLSSNDAVANSIMNGLGIGAIAIHHAAILGKKNLVRILPHLHTEKLPIYFIFNKHVKNRHRYMAVYEFLVESLAREKNIYP